MRKIIIIIAAVALLLSGCTSGRESKSQESGQKLTEKAIEQQSDAVKYPIDELKNSLDRKNLRERLLRTNKPDAIGYVYVLSFSKFIGYYTVKGKVSSTSSQMTPADIITRRCFSGGCDESVVVQGPGDDGTYGDNEPGIFFFTTEGTMVETTLDWIYTDQPLTVINVPELNK